MVSMTTDKDAKRKDLENHEEENVCFECGYRGDVGAKVCVKCGIELK